MQGWSESMSWESPWAEHSAPEIGDVNQQGFHFPEKHCDLFMYIYIFISFFLYIPTQYWPNVGLSQHDSQYVSICRISSIYLHILHTTHIYIYNIYIYYVYIYYPTLTWDIPRFFKLRRCVQQPSRRARWIPWMVWFLISGSMEDA